MQEYGHQCVVWQTAVNPVVALELLSPAPGRAPGCSARRRSTPEPFLDLLTEYGSPWGQQELHPVDIALSSVRGERLRDHVAKPLQWPRASSSRSSR